MSKSTYRRNAAIIRTIIVLGLSALLIIVGINLLKAGNAIYEILMDGKEVFYPHLGFREWISIHEYEFHGGGDAMDAYAFYQDDFLTPEYKEASNLSKPYKIWGMISIACATMVLGGVVKKIVERLKQ